eukprot:TRINITY_DN45603_c0_g1_i1.p1 TRINITY_DN45603_c0_g1~~TRINITY_DN45603_c0_g1_i1.p1  ORF type:complete len:188 (+),score=35.77 TRINITY_DN45603_c0_g1_i1:39-602(+)
MDNLATARVAVASASGVKVRAVEAAFNRLGYAQVEVSGFHTASEISEQPLGHNETIQGALNRLRNLQASLPDWRASHSHLVSMENGVFEVRVDGQSRYFDLAWVVVHSAAGPEGMSNSVGIEFDAQDVQAARDADGGFDKHTVGDFISKRIHCPSNDPHGALTMGILPRETLLADTIIAAVAQCQQP